MIINTVEAVKAPFEMPELPVAKAMWCPDPSFEDGIKGWILSGGAHHTIYSYDVSVEDLLDFAEFMDIEAVVIDPDTKIKELKQELTMKDILWHLKR